MTKTLAEIDFSYKGGRNYVHGTDIISALADHFGNELFPLDIRFNGRAVNCLSLVKGYSSDEAKVNIILTEAEQKLQYHLLDNGRQVVSSYDYEESNITGNADLQLEEKQLICRYHKAYNFWEQVVALNKYLLKKLFADVEGRWFFTRLEQASDVQDTKLLRLRMIKNLNFRLTKSEFYVDGKRLGNIYFTLVK